MKISRNEHPQPRLHSFLPYVSLSHIAADSQYMLFFGATMNCIPWVYVPEILPLQVRAKGTAIAISSNWVSSFCACLLPAEQRYQIWNFVIVMITPTLIGQLQWKAYLIFMATNLSFVPIIYFAYPETTNLTLEEIDYLFLEKNVVKHSKQVWKKGLSQDERRLAREIASGEVETPSEILGDLEAPGEKEVRSHHDKLV